MGRESRTLADLVRGRRRALGLSPQALAARAGIGRHTLRAIEEGRTVAPKPATLAVLAGALDLPPAALEGAPAPVAATGPGPAAPAWRRGCLGCGQGRGEARQALIAKIGAHGSLWLCHDCAGNAHSVAELLAAYRRARAGAG